MNNELKKININEADEKQLEKLPGIGPSKAKRIIEYREKNGKFKSLDELLNVNGIGPKTLEKIENYLAF
jgi:competence protein ComEA